MKSENLNELNEKPQKPITPKAAKPPKTPLFAMKPKKDPVAELTLDLQRVQADFENYKKRVATERSELMDQAKRSVLSELLPAFDNYDRAAAHLPEHLKDDAWAQGMTYINTQLEQIFDEMGVKKAIPKAGDTFDYRHMDALEHVPSKHPPETVAEVLTPGYEINGQSVRPASVKVSSGPPSKENQTDKQMTQSNDEGEL